MLTGNTYKPRIEVTTITLVDLLEFLEDLGPSSDEIVRPRRFTETRTHYFIDVTGPELLKPVRRIFRVVSTRIARVIWGKRRRRRAMGVTLEQVERLRTATIAEMLDVTRRLGVTLRDLDDLMVYEPFPMMHLFDPVPEEIQVAVLALLRSVVNARHTRLARRRAGRG